MWNHVISLSGSSCNLGGAIETLVSGKATTDPLTRQVVNQMHVYP